MMYVSLKLWMGSPSVASLGITGTFNDPVPEHIDLLTGGLSVYTENNQSTWSPAFPTIKNGGVWSDPAAQDGRTLLLGKEGNVLESIPLLMLAAVGLPRSVVISKLMEFSRVARDFWQEDAEGRPVYLELQAVGSPAPQYAIIYNMDITSDGDVLFGTNSPRVTLGIEREPQWRAIPPGGAPKVHTFYTRGIEPVNNVTPPSTAFYGAPQLDLDWTGAATYNSLVESSSLRAYDEVGTANINYLIIPAASIPGDEPALAVVSFIPQAAGPANSVPIFVSRSSRRDNDPSGNTVPVVGTLVNLRQRNTLNGGDGFISGAWAKLVDATFGLLSNGSTVTRHVARHNNALIATNEYLRWRVIANQWQGRYAVFVRGKVNAGSNQNFTLTFGVANNGSTTPYMSTEAARMASNAYGVSYLGIIDPTVVGSAVRDENTRLSNQSAVDFLLFINKATAVAVDLWITDIILMPIDEPNGLIKPDVRTWNVPYGIDTTGTFTNGRDEMIARFINPLSDAGRPLPYRGVPITLMPKKENRIYWLPFVDTSPYVTGTYRIRVDIVPRWSGLRDE
jgi:hypothetical protein